ncbi:ATP-binding protein [Haladaptatus sp. ZSTT2]|uniref:ATP-binding protein n=1 Tax=Haladaptatus sp. ZSTT2 TaxID=3120515 RepID=UPI00300ED778
MSEEEISKSIDGDGIEIDGVPTVSNGEEESGFNFSEPIDLTPQKTGLLDQLRADLDITGSFDEIGDNSLDAFERVRGGMGALRIEVEHRKTDEGEEELVIRDNAGGVLPADLNVFFSIGSRAGETGGRSVQRGAYGIGLKKATLRLAQEVTFATRHQDQKGKNNPGYGFTISEEWLKRESDWTVNPEPFDIEAGTTEIRLRGLRFDWEEHEEDIRKSLASTYRRQLGGSPFTENFDVSIEFQGEPLTPPKGINWGFPAFDELWPREFVMQIAPDDVDFELESPIKIRLVVGLLAEKDTNATGTDLYVQNRLIHEARTDEQGGYDVPGGLPSFNDAQHGRFKMCVSLESEADAADLPWNTTKDRIFPEDEKMVAVWEKLNNFVDRYFAAKFSNVPADYLAFAADDEKAANNGEIDGPLDYYDRQRVTDKPINGFPDVKQVETTAQAHAKLGIQRAEYFNDDDTTLRKQKQHVYLTRTATLFKSEFEPGTEYLNAPKSIMAILPDFDDEDEVNLTIEEVKFEARHHARMGVRYTGIEPWKEPLYEAYLRLFAGDESEFENLTAVDERPPLPDDGDGDGPDGPDVKGTNKSEERSFEFSSEGFETVTNVFGLSDDMTAQERGERIETAAKRLKELGFSLSFE